MKLPFSKLDAPVTATREHPRTVDATVGRASKAQFQLSWHHHADDADHEANLFSAGDRVQLLGSLGLRLLGAFNGRVSHFVYPNNLAARSVSTSVAPPPMGRSRASR